MSTQTFSAQANTDISWELYDGNGALPWVGDAGCTRLRRCKTTVQAAKFGLIVHGRGLHCLGVGRHLRHGHALCDRHVAGQERSKRCSTAARSTITKGRQNFTILRQRYFVHDITRFHEFLHKCESTASSETNPLIVLRFPCPLQCRCLAAAIALVGLLSWSRKRSRASQRCCAAAPDRGGVGRLKRRGGRSADGPVRGCTIRGRHLMEILGGRPGPLYRGSVPLGTVRTQSPGFPGVSRLPAPRRQSRRSRTKSRQPAGDQQPGHPILRFG